MCGNEWFVILAFVTGLMVGCAGTAWCIRFGLKAAWAVKNNEPGLPETNSEPDDNMDAEFKMLDRMEGRR